MFLCKYMQPPTPDLCLVDDENAGRVASSLLVDFFFFRNRESTAFS